MTVGGLNWGIGSLDGVCEIFFLVVIFLDLIVWVFFMGGCLFFLNLAWGLFWQGGLVVFEVTNWHVKFWGLIIPYLCFFIHFFGFF